MSGSEERRRGEGRWEERGGQVGGEGRAGGRRGEGSLVRQFLHEFIIAPL